MAESATMWWKKSAAVEVKLLIATETEGDKSVWSVK